MMDTEITALIDEQTVLENMSTGQIFEKASMDVSDCKAHFGDGLLKEFTIQELIEWHGVEDLLSEIGEEAVIKYFEIIVEE